MTNLTVSPSPSPALTVEATYLAHDLVTARGTRITNYDAPDAEARVADGDRVEARTFTVSISPAMAGLTAAGESPVWTEAAGTLAPAIPASAVSADACPSIDGRCAECGCHDGHHKPGCIDRPESGCPVDGCGR